MKKGWTLVLLGLMVSCSVFPVVSSQTPLPKSTPLGVTLYVGGTGPHNFTTIQSAINAAANGDTVFVYDDSAPYHEMVIVNRSISLIGENETSTIINASSYGSMIIVYADNVTIRNFTLQHSWVDGVLVMANRSVALSHLTINYSWKYGICIEPYRTRSSSISISDCTISEFLCGIHLGSTNDTVVERNIISYSECGIGLDKATRSTIAHNVMLSCDYGIGCTLSWDNTFTRNYIQGSLYGVYQDYSANRFEQNTFMDNSLNAFFTRMPLLAIETKKEAAQANDSFFAQHFPVLDISRWSGNYWGRPEVLPHPIFGIRGWLMPDVGARWYYPWIPGPRFEVDWHPAKAPYDVP